MRRILFLVDIDFTLACAAWRYEIAGPCPDKSNRPAVDKWLADLQPHGELLKDPPLQGVLDLINSIRGPHSIVYVTSRSKKYFDETRNWLLKHGAFPGPLYMREDDDYRSSRAYKEEVMLNLVEEAKPDLVIALDDDRDGDCSEMYLKHGWTHLKVIAPAQKKVEEANAEKVA